MYNTIESRIVGYSASPSFMPQISYCASCTSAESYTVPSHSIESLLPQSYSFSGRESKSYSPASSYTSNNHPDSKSYLPASAFVNPYANKTKFVDDAEQIKDLAEETFLKTTGKELPGNIIISVCSAEKMKSVNKDWHPGIEGFAINTNPSMIFVKNSDLAHVMVTLGHEIGHVLSNHLGNSRDEEAKAFAFEMAWINAIKENNIGNLSNALIIPEPAHNGLHDFALDFVLEKVNNGISPLDLFLNLSNKETVCS